MSMKDFTPLINAVIDERGFTRLDKLVYWAIRRFRNGKTGQCYPSLTTVADLVPCSRSSVQRALQNIKRAGFIDWERGRKGQSNSYIFPREDVPTGEPIHDSRTIPGVVMNDPCVYSSMTTDQETYKQINEPSESLIHWREKAKRLQEAVRDRDASTR
jgi:DNA-binding transcriptional MocR family regulator